MELKECAEARIRSECKEELVMLKEFHAGEVHSLEKKVKRVEDKYSAGQK